QRRTGARRRRRLGGVRRSDLARAHGRLGGAARRLAARARRTARARVAHAARRAAEPRLGARLQRDRDPGRRARLGRTVARGARHDGELAVRRAQRAAPDPGHARRHEAVARPCGGRAGRSGPARSDPESRGVDLKWKRCTCSCRSAWRSSCWPRGSSCACPTADSSTTWKARRTASCTTTIVHRKKRRKENALRLTQRKNYRLHASDNSILVLGKGMTTVAMGAPAGASGASGISNAETTYNYKVVRQFAVMTVVWGVVGMLVGVWIAAQLAWPQLNMDIPWITYSRLRPLHTNAVIFAFGGSALFATSYFVVQRTCQVPLFAPKLAAFTFWGW